jgi:hypothetical protein
MKKRAQLQIFETMIVLLIFFILIGMGFIFYGKVSKSNFETEKFKQSQLVSVAVAQKVMFLPELQCSEQDIVKDNCIDILKLQSAVSVMNSYSLEYFDTFGFSEIRVREIYPIGSTYDLYIRKPTNRLNGFQTNVPVSLFDPITRTNKFGVLTIKTYTK